MANHLELSAFKDLRKRIDSLALLNQRIAMGEYQSSDINYAIKTQVLNIHNNNFFRTCSRRWDLRTSFNVTKSNGIQEEVLSDGPISLCPLPDEENIYFRLHPTEETTGQDELLPTRDFLLSSFPWENILSPLLLMKRFEGNSGNEMLVPNLFRSMLINEQEKRGLPKLKFANMLVEICLISIESKPGKARHDFITVTEAIRLLSNKITLENICKVMSYELLAFKIASCNSLQAKHTSIIKTNKKPNPDNNSYKKSRTSIIPARTFVIFIDGLDWRILNRNDLIPDIKAIKSITDKSIHFKNFTSSANWTFPCLHSIHTGIPPYLSFSQSSFRHDPNLRVRPKENLINYQEDHVFFQYIVKSIIDNDSQINSKSFLTRRLAKRGHILSGIKTSRNHGWRYGLTHSLHYSFENVTTSNIISNLDYLISSTDQFCPSTIFIDIDCLHREDLTFPYKNKHSWTDYSEQLNNKGDSLDKLAGIVSHEEFELNYYKDRLNLIENVISDMLYYMNPNDNIILFSDHGSSLFPVSQNAYKTYPGSTLKQEKIWNPSLFVYAPNNPMFIGHQISDELVSTIDIYSIILSLNQIKDAAGSTFSNLPLCLGGLNRRQAAYSFGMNVHHPNDNGCHSFELVERLGNLEGSISTFDIVPPSNKSLSHSIKEMFPDYKRLLNKY